ncbi:hypothetical protein JCM5353_003041 [Sporobolomyces roseus]
MTDQLGQDTLLSSIYTLRNSLLTSFPSPSSPHSLHPLSSIPPSQLPFLRTQLAQTLSTLRTATQQFSSLLPSSSSAAPLDKLLSLSTQSSSSQSTLLNLTSTCTTLFPSLLNQPSRRRRRYPTLHPHELSLLPLSILPVLERVAKDLGLVCFRDDDESTEQPRDKVTLSLGGKVMVVDFELERIPSKGDEGVREVVRKVKVAYVFKGEQEFNLRAGNKLEQLFNSDSPKSEEEIETVEAEEERWSRVETILRELREVDRRMEREESRDWFTKLDQLDQTLEKGFNPLDDSSSSNLLPRLVANPSSLYPTLLIHSTPSSQLDPSYTTSPSSPRALEALRQIPGIYTIRFELPREEEGWYRARVQGRVVVGKTVGRRLLESLGVRFEAREKKEGEVREGEVREERGSRETMGQLLLAESDKRKGHGQTRSKPESEDASYTISFDQPSSSSSSSSTGPSSFRFKLAPDLSTAISQTEDGSFVVSDLWVSSTEMSEGEGEGMKSFRNAIEILREQIRINELVLSVVNSSSRDAHAEESGTDQAGPRKRRKVTSTSLKGKGGLSLDELLENNRFSSLDTSPAAPLPVYIHLSSPSLRTLESPSILLSFPTPHLPPHLASPLEIIISSSNRGFQVRVLSKRLEDRLKAVLEGEKAKMVLDRTGDLGVFLKWVCRTLLTLSSAENTAS